MKNLILGISSLVLVSFALLSFQSSTQNSNYSGEITSFEKFDEVANSGGTVLSKLKKETLLDFKKSLKFSLEGELATAKINGVKQELSAADYDKVWTLFSISDSQDYTDYQCESPNNCRKLRDWICLSGCSQSGDKKGLLEYKE